MHEGAATVIHAATVPGMSAAPRWESALITYPTAPPAACRYPPTPLSPLPCHTCSRPEPPERYPTNRFLSGLTCTEITSKDAKNGCFSWRETFHPFLFCRRGMGEGKTWTGHERLHHTDHSIRSYMNHSWQSGKSGATVPLDTDTYKK